MEQCNCYYQRLYRDYAYDITGTKLAIFDKLVGECWGTKEREQCSCGGDPSKCDFYPEKRQQTEKGTFDKEEIQPMNTAEMWLAAQNDGKKYKCNGMRYSKNKGFYDPTNGAKWPPSVFSSIEDIMACNWRETKEMTKAEAEKALGVDIVD